MGVQILNKDVSVVSTILGKAKANISSIWGATGWSGGGGGPATQGPFNPGSAANRGFGDDPWSNVNNIFTSDNTYATCPSSYPGNYMDYFQAYNFGFSIPTGATIDGIEVKIEAKSTNAGEGFYEVFLWKGLYNDYTYGGSFGGIYANILLTTSDVIYTVGGPTNKWVSGGSNWSGQSITAEDINFSQFGVVIGGDPHTGTISIDNITMKVYYTT